MNLTTSSQATASGKINKMIIPSNNWYQFQHNLHWIGYIRDETAEPYRLPAYRFQYPGDTAEQEEYEEKEEGANKQTNKQKKDTGGYRMHKGRRIAFTLSRETKQRIGLLIRATEK